MPELIAICAGQQRPFRGRDKSAIAKQPLVGKVALTLSGVAGDEQADLKHHGGPDMAVHHYPLDHHVFWRDELGGNSLLDEPGAFGSNLGVTGLTEGDVLLGDRYRVGTALIEVCQPRQPCWKIEHRFGTKGMVKTIMRTGRCGWFYRVIEAGEAAAGDAMVLEQPGLPGWTMARVFEAIWGSGTAWDHGLIAEIAMLPPLADKLRAQLRAKIA